MLRILKEQSVADRQSTPKEDGLRKEALDIFNLSSNRFEIFLKCKLTCFLLRLAFLTPFFFLLFSQGSKVEIKSTTELYLTTSSKCWSYGSPSLRNLTKQQPRKICTSSHTICFSVFSCCRNTLHLLSAPCSPSFSSIQTSKSSTKM